jgi:hypothetical protein
MTDDHTSRSEFVIVAIVIAIAGAIAGAAATAIFLATLRAAA